MIHSCLIYADSVLRRQCNTPAWIYKRTIAVSPQEPCYSCRSHLFIFTFLPVSMILTISVYHKLIPLSHMQYTSFTYATLVLGNSRRHEYIIMLSKYNLYFIKRSASIAAKYRTQKLCRLMNPIWASSHWIITWLVNWGRWCQKQVSTAGISNCIPQFTVGNNYLSLPEIPASGAKVFNSVKVSSS